MRSISGQLSQADMSNEAAVVRDALLRLQLVGTTEEIAREAKVSESVAAAALEELRVAGEVARTEFRRWILISRRTRR